ncbi:hypothetical protein BP5796_09673 [Coleophoma crateriformis]|uniref:Methyltransferase type 11 domain-containing protein n=1 Tax=Coleophoma crateriformis TaxID=565419 RepID=A0A3D8QZC8_9HELO|nr:hypothetical protein BP5796_09673 [Coleophoma crateriformis]
MAMSERELKELADPKYWDERYIKEREKNGEDSEATLESFEWFRDFQKLRPFFETNLPSPQSECHILHLGCGNSTLTADLHALGYTNQTSVDFSHVVIDAMKIKYSDLDTRWKFMDVRDLQLPDASVDVAIDKGTLDAMIHGSLWDPPEDVRENVGKYVQEVGRVLKPGGVWLYITYRQPHFMKIHLEQEALWNLEVRVLEDPDGAGGFEYFSFVMQKRID